MPRPKAPDAPSAAKANALVEALFDLLPPQGSVWPQSGRTAWLSLIGQAFTLLYKDSDDTGV